MAALEKIRKRAAILTIVIGAGLLAFILEEAVRASGAFTTDTLAAKVGNEKIEMQEFQNISQARQQQRDADSKVDPAVMQQQILQEVIQEKLLSQECDEANIKVSGEEVTELMVNNPPQSIQQICQQNGIDPKSLFDLLKNPNADPNDQSLQQIRALYEQESQKMANQLLQAKLGMLLMGCLQANDVDIQLTKDESAVYNVTYAKVDYATVDDNKVKVTDADLKAAYDKYKNLFKLDEENRRIHYIKVDVDPSSKDKAAAAQKINKIYAELQSKPGISGIRANSDVVIDSVTTTQADKQVFGAKVENKNEVFNNLVAGGLNACDKKDPTGRDRNTFMYKVTSTYQSIDSVGLDMVLVQGPKARQDSVMALLEGGIAIDSLAGNPNIQIQKSNPQQLARAFQFPDSVRTKINANASGSFFTWQANNDGAIFAKVAQSNPAITFYNIARARFTDYPSEATVTELQNNLQKYLNKNKDIKDFEKNAKAAHYDVVEEIINPGTTQIGAQQSQFGMMPGIPESRKAVKWAFENKPGTISQIFSDDNAMLVVAVDEVYKDYIPMTDPTVKQQLTDLVKSEKKAEMLMKQYNGKANDVAGYAALMKCEVDSASVSMGAPQQMLEAKVAGLIAGLGNKAQGKVQLIAGRNAIYAVQVNGTTPARDIPKQQVAMQYRQQHFPIQQMFNAILQGSRKIKNNLIKFS
jgi:peptidyl-prolyl cis-trans isomerase D